MESSFNLPTTVIWAAADAVEKDGESAVTSHEKFPDKPKLTFLITTWVAFETGICVVVVIVVGVVAVMMVVERE